MSQILTFGVLIPMLIYATINYISNV